MGRWMRFALDRKRQMFAAAAAGGAAAMMMTVMTQRAMAHTYVITDGSRAVTGTTFAAAPDRVLGETGSEISGMDGRTQQITVRYHGQSLTVSSQGETVASLLERWGLEPGEGDILSQELQAPTWDGMVIRVDQVVVRQESYAEAIPHQVEYCADATLPRGAREVLTPGADGELLCVAKVTYINGRETERSVLSRTMVSSPVTQIVAQGTGDGPQAQKADAMPEISDGFIRLPTGEVLTYTGTTVRLGTVAVDPRCIPYGTRMFIVSDDGCYIYGLSVAEDCGGAIKGNRIDLYFPTYEECIQFGRRTCTIYFLG